MHRSMLLAILLITLLSLSSCNASPVSLSAPEPSTPASEIEKSASSPTEPERDLEPIPYDQQIASITPEKREQILEKEAENSDSVGWLTVPGTTIDDVVLLNPIWDNNYYPTHDFAKQPDKNGTYCMDYRAGISSAATRDSIPRNTTLYAHNFDDDPNGIFFAQLKKYKDPTYAKAHPYIFFSTAEEEMAWEIFAVYDATVSFPYIVPGVFWSAFEPLLESVYAASIYDYGFQASPDDKLLTLSTCTFSVPGHEAMPITETNDYRFVIMARLVRPEEQIKSEASLTVNDNPLVPDELPWLSHLSSDVFMLNGIALDNMWVWYNRTDSIQPIQPDRLVPVGKIEKSNLVDPVSDWEATQLPVGTVILQDPDYADVYVADTEWGLIPYVIQKWQREVESVRYTHQNQSGVITDKILEAGQADEYMERLAPYIDMVHFTPLPDSIENINIREDRDEIRLDAKNSLSTFYQVFFLGTPPSVGKEVLIIRQPDGLYYGDSSLYPKLKAELDALFGEAGK